MPLTPEEIKDRSFPIALRGYEKEVVDSFLQRIAQDYEAAISAIASAADPYASLGREVGAVLRSAKDSADGLRVAAEQEAKVVRSRAADEAADVRRQAAEEAAATLEAAREKALQLRREAEKLLGSSKDEGQATLRAANEEAAEIRRRAAEEATSTLDAAAEKADKLTEEAKRHALELARDAEARCEEMLREATERHHQLVAFERELEERVAGVDGALGRLQAALASAPADELGRAADVAAPVSAGASPSQARAGRLASLDPDLDQVANAVAGDPDEAEEAAREVEVSGPGEPARSAGDPK